MLVSGPSGEHTLIAQRELLKAVEEHGSYTKAADSIGIARATVYNWIEAEKQQGVDEESPVVGSFLRGLRRAKEIAAERILGESYAHAVSEARDMPATVNRIFHIKRWYPEYRDQLNIKHSGAVLQARVDLNQLDPTERVQLLGLVTRRLQLATEGRDESNVAVDVEAEE